MSKKVYGFAIIGIGMIGRAHADQIKQTENAKLVAVFHKDETKAGNFASEYGCEFHTSLEEMLAREDIDIVCICTPSGLHGEQAIQCAEAGKHIITEKPIEITLDKARQMIDACKQANVKLGVISQSRFNPDIQEARKRIQDGDFGPMLLGSAAVNWYRDQEYYDSGAWRGTWEWDGGGALMNQGIHTVDVFQYLMGPVESVYAHCETLGHERIEVEDVAVATIKFKNGAVGTLTATTVAYPGLNTRLELFGKDGCVVIENNETTFTHTRADEGKETASQQKEVERLLTGDPNATVGSLHKVQFADMISAIEEDREPIINGEDGYKPLQIILAIYESARTGKPVTLS